MAGKYKVQLKQADGTMADLPLVATYDSNGNKIADKYATAEKGIYYIKGTSTTAGTWTGTHADITAYYDGLTIAYHTNKAGGSSTTTLNINGLGAKTCYLRGTTKITTHYAVDTVVMFTYITVSGTGRWVTSDYDANNYAYLRQYFETANSELPLVMSHTTATSGDDSYKTAYGGVVAGVTLNPSTKTISATAFKENGTSLADKYVAKVSGKGLSTNDYTTTEKTKLAGLSNYSLPTATSSVLGGVRIGSNITNSNGIISISKANVTNALGYEPVSDLAYTTLINRVEGVASSVSSKADKYVSSGGAKILSSADVNTYNLRGVTISGIPNSTIDLNSFQSFQISNSSSTVTYEVQMGGAMGEIVLYRNGDYLTSNEGETMYFYHGYDGQDGQYYARSYTFPSDDDFYVTSNSASLKDFQVGSGNIVVDCEYNYNEIQTVKAEVETLKETVNNSSGGGAIYRHRISFGHSGPYAMDAITVYSSSSEPIGQSSQAFELLGTGWYATYMSSMYGDGMIIAKMTDSSTLSFKGAVSGTDTIMAVYDTVKQV